MNEPFEGTTIGRIALRNRIVRSATWEGACDGNGAPMEKLFSCYDALSEGGVGLIIGGYAYVSPEGKQSIGKMGMHDDSLVPSLKGLTSRVHDKGGKVVAQLVHAGGQANRNVSGHPPVAPSAVSVPFYREIPTELDRAEIGRIVADFARAAARAKEAGFDGVQLHGAHAYLLGQFLSPLTNARGDEYGGSLENRARILVETIGAVKRIVGKEYPVWIKLNGDDFVPGGTTAEEAVSVARFLEAAGIDAIEVSGGTPASGARTPARTPIDSVEKEGYHRDLSRGIKRHVRIPVGVVGGFRTLSVIEDTLRAGDADFVSLSRPLIREPGLVNRWASGDRGRAACISCNGCFLPALREGGIRCVPVKNAKN
jgi:2,4-dienoyl-CoA reductase-like NADH-dependent reductase (Old Yellow Enzyme family)